MPSSDVARTMDGLEATELVAGSVTFGNADAISVPINGAGITGRPPGPPPVHPPMAVMVSRADRDYIDAAVARSNELAVARGHVVRS